MPPCHSNCHSKLARLQRNSFQQIKVFNKIGAFFAIPTTHHVTPKMRCQNWVGYSNLDKGLTACIKWEANTGEIGSELVAKTLGLPKHHNSRFVRLQMCKIEKPLQNVVLLLWQWKGHTASNFHKVMINHQEVMANLTYSPYPSTMTFDHACIPLR